jgi:phosphate transport system substrate-binding protein
MGPPSTSGTRDALVRADARAGLPRSLSGGQGAQGRTPRQVPQPLQAHPRRRAYVDKGENDNLIVQGLSQNPNALGVFGYSYLEENIDRLHGVPIEGVSPSYATSPTASYPGARPLFLYVKKRHLRACRGCRTS